MDTEVKPRPIDWDKVGQMFIAGANIVQAAAAVGVHRTTLYRRYEAEFGTSLETYWQDKHELGNNMLHQAQFSKAVQDKNPTMQIWLGKQRLGQKENLEDKINREVEKKFDEKMDQIMSLLGASPRDFSEQIALNIDESSINNDT